MANKFKSPAPLSPVAFPIAGQPKKPLAVDERRDFFDPLSKISTKGAYIFLQRGRRARPIEHRSKL